VQCAGGQLSTVYMITGSNEDLVSLDKLRIISASYKTEPNSERDSIMPCAGNSQLKFTNNNKKLARHSEMFTLHISICRLSQAEKACQNSRSHAMNKYICENSDDVTVCPCIDNCWKNLAVRC
jgi:hypothetical protein